MTGTERFPPPCARGSCPKVGEFWPASYGWILGRVNAAVRLFYSNVMLIPPDPGDREFLTTLVSERGLRPFELILCTQTLRANSLLNNAYSVDRVGRDDSY
jgi:hypothetical protein